VKYNLTIYRTISRSISISISISSFRSIYRVQGVNNHTNDSSIGVTADRKKRVAYIDVVSELALPLVSKLN